MQSRKRSLIESLTNILIGYWVAVAATQLILPLFGLPVQFRQNLAISGLFTVVSLIRSYVIRRCFNRLDNRSPSG